MEDKISILIIDDDPNLRKTLSDILRAKGYEVHAAKDGTEGLALLKQQAIHLALVDLRLPDISGLEILNRIKSDHPSTEAIILTGNATLDSAIEATNRGAFSYLQKPYEIDQLLLHIRRAMEKQQSEKKILAQSMELQKLNEELKALYEEAKSSSLHDPLTGLANRRSLQIQLEKSFESAKRYGHPLSVIMLDIDHFKKYNDTHGHVEGDRMLVKIAHVLLEAVRMADHVFRYGGEEFLIMLPQTELTNACLMAERVRKAVESGAEVTISLGVYSYHESLHDKDVMIQMADNALYQAKQKGRNRVEAGSF
jgi:two-component system cell cycle response regulator